MDFNKLSHRDLIHGMSRVVQNMVRESDPRLSSYVDHMVFMTSLAAEGGFVNEPFLKYDHHVVDKAMRNRVRHRPHGELSLFPQRKYICSLEYGVQKEQ